MRFVYIFLGIVNYIKMDDQILLKKNLRQQIKRVLIHLAKPFISSQLLVIPNFIQKKRRQSHNTNK